MISYKSFFTEHSFYSLGHGVPHRAYVLFGRTITTQYPDDPALVIFISCCQYLSIYLRIRGIEHDRTLAPHFNNLVAPCWQQSYIHALLYDLADDVIDVVPIVVFVSILWI